MDNHLFDTHIHLDLFKSTEDIIEIIDEHKIYTIAVTNLPILYKKLKTKISSKYIRPALGFHPELLFEYKKYIPQMWNLLEDTKYIGEVGLDFSTGSEFKELQISFFTELIERCNKLGDKILTIHSKQSAKEVVSIIGNTFNGKIILHWYSGGKKIMQQAVENGYYFSINYAMLKSASGREIIKLIPLERLLLETDAPFVMYNNNPFSPLEIKYIVSELSLLLGFKYEKMNSILWSNFKALLK